MIATIGEEQVDLQTTDRNKSKTIACWLEVIFYPKIPRTNLAETLRLTQLQPVSPMAPAIS